MTHEAAPNKQQANSKAGYNPAKSMFQAIASEELCQEFMDQARQAPEQKPDPITATAQEALEQARALKSNAEVYLEKLRSQISQRAEETSSQARVSDQESEGSPQENSDHGQLTIDQGDPYRDQLVIKAEMRRNEFPDQASLSTDHGSEPSKATARDELERAVVAYRDKVMAEAEQQSIAILDQGRLAAEQESEAITATAREELEQARTCQGEAQVQAEHLKEEAQ